MQIKNNNTALAVIITLLVVIILGLVGFIIYDKVINKDTNEPNNGGISNNENSQETSKIEVTSSLEKELRDLIPTVKYCNQYLYKQYNGGIFKSTDLTSEDKTSDFEQCQGILFVNTNSYKNDSTNTEVYLYDYVLLYDQQGSNECQGCFYGTDYQNINIKYDDIELVGDSVSKDSFKKYGQIYKYTFKLVDDNYEYVSTEAVYE